MIDPLARLQTLQSLEAQRKRDIEAIQIDNYERAYAALTPIRDAIRQLADAGVCLSRYGKNHALHRLSEFLRLDSYHYQPRETNLLDARVKTVTAWTKSAAITLRLDEHAEISFAIMLPDKPGERLDKISFVVSTGAHKDIARTFSTADEAIEYGLEKMRDWLIVPKKEEEERSVA